MNTKDLVSLLKQVDSKYHYDIFIILKKYDIKYTRNSNGIFFNMDQIDQSILDEVYNYLNMSTLYSKNNSNLTQISHSSISESRDIDMIEQYKFKNKNENREHEDKVKKVTSKSLNEECENIVKNVINDDTLKVSKILNDIEKDKSYIHKKTAVNKFSVAKKKYAKQVITTTEQHELSNMLDFDE
jgi:hypothetical protein